MQARGSAWILLRGWGRESGHWGEFPLSLADALHTQVLCLDLPGVGARNNEASPLTIQRQVDAVRNAITALRANGTPGLKLYLLAISFGSMVATDWAQRFPEELSGLVMINPSFKGLSPWYCRLRPQAIPFIIRAVFEDDPVKSELRVLSRVSNSPALYLKTATLWARIRKTRPVSKLNFFRQLLAASLAKLPLQPAFRVPTLILGSQADRLVNSSRCSSDAAQALKAELKFHPTAGHDLPLDDPEWLVGELVAWLQKHLT